MPPSNPEKERRALLGASIQRLVSTMDWDSYKGALLDMEQRVLEGLAKAPVSDIQYQQGLLQGIRDVQRLPKLLMAQGRAE